MFVATVRSLPRKYHSYANEGLNLSWTHPTVISVVQGSPAAYAGIKIGDQIQFLDEDPVPATNTQGFVAGYLRSRGEQPVRVALRRDGAEQAIELKPILACAIPVVYVSSEMVNAYATENDKITIFAGIVALARTDAQLAHVIGPELAHANLGHADKKTLEHADGHGRRIGYRRRFRYWRHLHRRHFRAPSWAGRTHGIQRRL
jgi:hypothetical protein